MLPNTRPPPYSAIIKCSNPDFTKSWCWNSRWCKHQGHLPKAITKSLSKWSKCSLPTTECRRNVFHYCYPNSINTNPSNLPVRECRREMYFITVNLYQKYSRLFSKNIGIFPKEIYPLWEFRSSKANISLWNGNVSTQWKRDGYGKALWKNWSSCTALKQEGYQLYRKALWLNFWSQGCAKTVVFSQVK